MIVYHGQKRELYAGLGPNTCKYCIPHKTRISNILDQIFYFDKVDITGGHMGNDGWSNAPLGSTRLAIANLLYLLENLDIFMETLKK